MIPANILSAIKLTINIIVAVKISATGSAETKVRPKSLAPDARLSKVMKIAPAHEPRVKTSVEKPRLKPIIEESPT
jgi:hypothetical protein